MPAAVDPPCTCRFINGTTRHRGILSVLSPRNSPGALLRVLFRVILRQSPRRGCSRTSLYAPPPDGGFSLSDAEISPSAPRALFRELLCQSPCRRCSRTIMYAPPPDGGFSLSDAEISPSAPRALFGDLLCQSPIPQCGHVRLSTLPFAEGAFSRISSKWRRQAMNSASGRL